ncbi:MAG: TonB-dependent receptor [Thermoanaerobaculia bacterium]|nr:TonB-dependent receptor [Thermoanaerobaculia bacterium]
MIAVPTLMLWWVASLSPSAIRPFPDTWSALLRNTPGLLVLAAGPRELELAAGGFSESGTRRLAVRVEGRDATLPVFGDLDGGAPGVPVREIAAVTLTPGPGAGSGVSATAAGTLDVRTRPAGDDPGFALTLGAGEREFGRLGLRAAGRRNSWAGSAWLAAEQDAGFRTSHTGGSAPVGQPVELVPLARSREEALGLGGRLERAPGTVAPTFVLAAGVGRYRGTVRFTPFGRAEEDQADGSWVRAELAGRGFDITLRHAEHDARDLVFLASGSESPLVERRSAVAAGYQRAAGPARWRLAAEPGRDEARSGRGAAILADTATDDHQGLLGALDLALADRVSVAGSVRWNAGDALPEELVTGRLEIAWAPRPDHRLHLAWGEGFVVPTLAERYGRFGLGSPLDLGIFERAFGLDLGFSAVPSVAFGSVDLAPEQVRGWELGYRGQWRALAVSARLFRERHRQFIGDFQLGAGPPREAYRVPAGVPAETARRFLATLDAFLPTSLRAALTHDAAGRPLLALSLVNGGRAETQGGDLRLSVLTRRGLHAALELGYLELDPEVERPGGPFLLNAPEKRARVILGWRAARGGVELAARWWDDFEWASGVFRGLVREAQTVDVTGRFDVSAALELGITVDNAGNERHAETFGGDFWGRQARLFLHWQLDGHLGREVRP